MPLEVVGIGSFRNLADARVALDACLNLVVGRNAQGKTSLLEAVYVLGTGKSFRSPVVRETVRWGTEVATVTGVLAGESRSRLGIEVGPQAKRYALDGERVALAAYLGTLTPVFFGAQTARLCEGPPAERRAFLDAGILALEPSCLRELGAYAAALRQKLSLLQQARYGREVDRGALAAFNLALAGHGVRLVERRRAYVESVKKKSRPWRRPWDRTTLPSSSATTAPGRRLLADRRRPGASPRPWRRARLRSCAGAGRWWDRTGTT